MGVGRRLRLACRLTDGVGREWIYPPVDPYPYQPDGSPTPSHFATMGQPPNIVLIPRLDMTGHLPFPRPAPTPPSMVSEGDIAAGLEGEELMRSVAAILRDTDMRSV